MKIGIDLTPLQGPHRMRGIGYTVLSVINNLPAGAAKKHSFVFYMSPHEQDETLSLLDLTALDYEIRDLKPPAPLGPLRKRNWLFKKAKATIRTLWVLLVGNPEGANYNDLDWFLQFDQNKPLPSRRTVKSTVILYDLIPYVLEHLYLNSYRTARQHGKSRKRAILSQLKRTSYIVKTRLITQRASRLIAISEHTKKDFIRFIHVNPNKIEVCLLGISDKPFSKKDTPKELTRYLSSSWGPMPRATPLPKKPFLLFVGGADPRRKLVDLVAAFNNLRAQGHDILLIFSGDTMFGPDKVGSAELHEYLKDSAYLDDIYFLGFTDDSTRDWLYQNALAFVYPSIYEGFGLPVLEAMRYGTPVITYGNSSISEIAGRAAIYTNGYLGIVSRTKELLLESKSTLNRRSHSGRTQAKKYTWEKTAQQLTESLPS